VFIRLVFFLSLITLASCVSTRATPPPSPPPTLPIATGIPVTPKPQTPHAQAAPSATVETLPTPENAAEIFRGVSDELKNYKPPESDPKLLYDALARGIGEFLTATANGDVSLEEQPALEQLRDALGQIKNLPDKAQAQVTAIHTGDDQGGSRDLIFVAMQGVMGLPIIGLERLGLSYEPLAPISFNGIATTDARYFYPAQLDARDMTGDGQHELIYVLEFPGGSGTTNELTVARWIADKRELHTIFHADLINWAGESDYQIETTADASSIKLTFPWFGTFDHKMTQHPTATQRWEYDDTQDRFVKVSQTIESAKFPRHQLNEGERAFRDGQLEMALASYHRAWSDSSLEKETFTESKADSSNFAKFREAMVHGLLGRDQEAKKLLSEARSSGGALEQLVAAYLKNFSGKEGALRAWIALPNTIDLYELLYNDENGTLGFPFEAREIYWQGGIVASYLNTHSDADKNPEAMWNALDALGFKLLPRAATDLNGDGVNEFFVVTQEGRASSNQGQTLWLIYTREMRWRVRAVEIADTVQFQGDAVALPNSQARALKLKLPEAYTPNEIALTWDGTRIIWLDAKTLEPRANDNWTSVGGGMLDDDY